VLLLQASQELNGSHRVAVSRGGPSRLSHSWAGMDEPHRTPVLENRLCIKSVTLTVVVVFDSCMIFSVMESEPLFMNPSRMSGQADSRRVKQSIESFPAK
jgi:hypothetical protein